MTIECPIKLSKNGCTTNYSITSPRTGKTLTLSFGWLMKLPRVRGRIAQAVSYGRRAAAFTADELRAFKATHDEMVVSCTPDTRPAVYRDRFKSWSNG